MNRSRRQKDGGRKMSLFFCRHLSAFPSTSVGRASARAGPESLVSDGSRGRSPHPPRFMVPMRVQCGGGGSP